jgi:flagellin-specific chaperone FliS
METKQSQIKINLPLKLKKKVEKRAGEYDMTIAGYTKHLMMMDLSNKETLVYQLSDGSLRAIKQARKDVEQGKFSTIESKEDLKKFLDNL